MNDSNYIAHKYSIAKCSMWYTQISLLYIYSHFQLLGLRNVSMAQEDHDPPPLSPRSNRRVASTQNKDQDPPPLPPRSNRRVASTQNKDQDPPPLPPRSNRRVASTQNKDQDPPPLQPSSHRRAAASVVSICVKTRGQRAYWTMTDLVATDLLLFNPGECQVGSRLHVRYVSFLNKSWIFVPWPCSGPYFTTEWYSAVGGNSLILACERE